MKENKCVKEVNIKYKCIAINTNQYNNCLFFKNGYETDCLFEDDDNICINAEARAEAERSAK